MFPKKSLGQHFLLNPTTIDKIIRLAHVTSDDQVLEVGPGKGLMTQRLALLARRVVAVEKDRSLVTTLRAELGGLSNLELVEADFLEWDIRRGLREGSWKVVANLPYNVATESIFHLLEASTLFTSFYLMVQREVGLRLCASPGSRDYGLLSVMSQILSQNRVVMQLPPGAFTPPPKVRSVLVEFRIQSTLRYDIYHLPTFERVVTAAFSQRRKMIRNSLTPILKGGREADELLAEAGIRPTERAERLSIAQFTRLANLISVG